jgi:hypothetical protein
LKNQYKMTSAVNVNEIIKGIDLNKLSPAEALKLLQIAAAAEHKQNTTQKWNKVTSKKNKPEATKLCYMGSLCNKKEECPYTHPAAGKHYVPPCKFKIKCTKQDCEFHHPERKIYCKYGPNCTKTDTTCKFLHTPQVVADLQKSYTDVSVTQGSKE